MAQWVGAVKSRALVVPEDYNSFSAFNPTMVRARLLAFASPLVAENLPLWLKLSDWLRTTFVEPGILHTLFFTLRTPTHRALFNKEGVEKVTPES